MRDVAGIDKLRQHAADLLGYLERNEAALVHYAAREAARRADRDLVRGERGRRDHLMAHGRGTAMRWSRATVQPFLDVRTAVLNDALEDAFRRRHHGFRPANDDHRLTAVAA